MEKIPGFEPNAPPVWVLRKLKTMLGAGINRNENDIG